MGSISDIIVDLKFARSTLLESIDGLSQRELTEIPIYESWMTKDILAHLIGWDQRVIKILPLMLQNRAGEIPGVEVETHNQASVMAWKDKPLIEVRAELESIYQQILDIISSIDHVEIDRRHDRNGRIVTIRSYVIDIMSEHQRQHAAEIKLWRNELEQAIDPAAIQAMLTQNRTEVLATLKGLSEKDALEKNRIGTWSIKDVIGHLTSWEQRMVEAAYHIYDPSLPKVPLISLNDDIDEWNETLAMQWESCTWSEVFQALNKTREAVVDFAAKLTPDDWRLRGPYPWLDDQGTIAELLSQMAEHDAEHLPDLRRG